MIFRATLCLYAIYYGAHLVALPFVQCSATQMDTMIFRATLCLYAFYYGAHLVALPFVQCSA
jgi:hypothetical protein